MMKKLSLVLFSLFLYAGVAVAQTHITGTVISEDDGEPVIGAAVRVSGTELGGVTDVNGAFDIVLPEGKKVIVISYLGMEPVEVVAKNGMRIILKSGSTDLNEVVVTAMGISREKKSLGYATQDLNADKLSQAMGTDLSSAMSGKLSGINITASSGMPGASSHITIRGVRSFTGDNTPLYVIDGMPVASAADFDTGQSVTGSDYANRAFDIDPNDIESINVLKGQAASALYGMRASNGVIIITTKSGKGLKQGKPQITYNTSLAFSTVSTLPKVQTEYAQGMNGAFNPNSSFAYGPKIADLPNDPEYGGNADNEYTQAFGMHSGQYYSPKRAAAGLDPWTTPKTYDNLRDFFETGVSWSNSVSISQNLGKGDYSFSLGNTSQTGIIPETGSERYNAKLNASLKLNTYFTTGFSGNFVASKVKKQTGANDGLMATLYGAPSSYDLKGIPNHVEGDPYSQVSYRTLTFDNPYWATENNEFSEKSQRFFGNVYLKFAYPINDDMKVEAKYQLGDDAYTTNYKDMFGYGHRGSTGEIDDNSLTINELNSLFTASYDWKINPDWHLNVLYGNEIVQNKSHQVEAFGNSFNFPGWNSMNNVQSYTAREYNYKTRTIGNFFNLSADYKDMLFLNVTGRSDIVSSMPRNNRTFFYPSVSLGFIFTELQPLKNDILTYGKLRASYAEVGMAGTYYQSYYDIPAYGGGFSSGTPISYPIGSVVAYKPYERFYDPDLKPQNTRSYEVGVDLGFLHGLFTLNYTFSRQNVKDQIFDVPMSGSTGYSEFRTNGGSIHTNSHELTIGAKPIDTKNVKWDMSLNFTKIDNYVDKLAEGVESIYLGGFVEPQIRAGIGYKFPVIYGKSFLRNENGDIVVDEDGLPMAGEEKVLGSVAPDFQLGFNTSLELYKFRLSATLDWKQGGYMYAGTYTMMDYYGTSQRSADFRNKGQFLFELPAVKQNEDGSYSPNDIYISSDDALFYFNAMNNISESFVHKSSYLKLREVSLSYPIVEKPWLNITLSAFARNVLLWSAIKGFDPEASQGNNNMAGGFERFSLPGSSTYGFGLTFNF